MDALVLRVCCFKGHVWRIDRNMCMYIGVCTCICRYVRTYIHIYVLPAWMLSCCVRAVSWDTWVLCIEMCFTSLFYWRMCVRVDVCTYIDMCIIHVCVYVCLCVCQVHRCHAYVCTCAAQHVSLLETASLNVYRCMYAYRICLLVCVCVCVCV